MAFQIRLATKKDAADCIRLSKSSWPGWWSRNEKLGARHIRTCIQEKTCLVATECQTVIAFMVWRTLWSKIHVQDIFVEEEYRRHALGSRLLERVEALALKQGFKEIVSDCDVSNKASISFHLRNGFKKRGRIKDNWDHESSIVFSKKLVSR